MKQVEVGRCFFELEKFSMKVREISYCPLQRGHPVSS